MSASITISREPLKYGTIPNPCTYTGLIPSSKNTFVFAATEQHNDPSIGTYSETLYYYADATGKIVIDFTPFIQRAFARLYNNNDTIIDALTAKWRYNQIELAIDMTYYAADVPMGLSNPLSSTDEGNYIVYGGVPLNRRYLTRDYLTYAGDQFLTGNTTIELNRYLPSNLCAFMDPTYAPITFELKKAGVLVADLALSADSTFNTSYIAKTYGDGEYTLSRKNYAYTPKNVYKLVVKNDDCVLTELANERAVYLRWLNSRGGFSFGIFKVRSEGRAIVSDVIGKEYTQLSPNPADYGSGLYEGGFTVLSKATTRTLQIGLSQVGWDRMPDMLDLLSSVDVCAWDQNKQNNWQTTFGTWTPVLAGGSVSPRRDYNYNDFTCEVTFPELFTQKR